MREIVPLYRTSKDEVVTQFDKDVIEKLGLLKMDFLGLKTLTVIDDCLKSMAAAGEPLPDFERMKFDDPDVYDLFCAGDTDGIFQFESSGMRDLLRTVAARAGSRRSPPSTPFSAPDRCSGSRSTRTASTAGSRSPTSSPNSRRSWPRPTGSSSTRNR